MTRVAGPGGRRSKGKGKAPVLARVGQPIFTPRQRADIEPFLNAVAAAEHAAARRAFVERQRRELCAPAKASARDRGSR